MVQVTNISKRFQEEQVLHNFNLRIESGQLTVLIGPSGCGKSTVLKIIMGLVQQDDGTVSLDHKKVVPASIQQIRLKMGYVIQEGGLFPHLTGRKNVTLVAHYLGWSELDITDRLEYLCDLVQLPIDMLEKYPNQLSGGQRQRISLMRALMLDPDVLLLDEPLGALDPLIRSDLQQDLKVIFQKLGKTVLLVTHDMGEAAYFGDHIVLMRHGEIVQQGKLEELVHKPLDPFVTRFIKAQKSPLDTLTGI